MHFIKNGELLESKEQISIDKDGYGIADQEQHTARFAPSITDPPAVIYADPGGNVVNIKRHKKWCKNKKGG